jgi:hypothetical protein
VITEDDYIGYMGQAAHCSSDEHQHLLGSVGVGDVWDGRIFEARCQARQFPLHPAPNRDCKCGIWAMEREEQLTSVISSYGSGAAFAYGRVQLWGRFVRHRLGYRAQFARPYDIVVENVSEHIAAQLRDFYGVSVRLAQLRCAVCRQIATGPSRGWVAHHVYERGEQSPSWVLTCCPTCAPTKRGSRRTS